MLTDKQEMFCKEYIIDFNATQAAIRSGYSDKTSGQIGEQNLKKLEIQNRIKELIEERNNRVQVDADYVLKQAVKLHERCMQEVRPKTIRGQQTKNLLNSLILQRQLSITGRMIIPNFLSP
ncbi:terminase small subunit [Dysgonomonas mossii]|uniref:terminase small subunit n=1 Tax=Dysgonomonas mossii TaxID=163665 RepID=UPI003991E883